MKRVSVIYLVKDPPIDRLAAQVEYMREVADEFVFVVDDRTDAASVGIIGNWPGTRIVPFTWVDDFAAARNAALPKVTRPWTLHLDPDELPSFKMMEIIRYATQPGQPDNPAGWLFWTRNWWGGTYGEEMPYHWHLRLWRTGRGKFYRRVHELVEIDGLPEPMTRGGKLVVYAPQEAYLIHSKPAELLVPDQEYYEKLGERSL